MAAILGKQGSDMAQEDLQAFKDNKCLLDITVKGREQEEGGAPDPPGRDVILGQQKSAKHQQHQEQKGAASGGHILIAAQRPIEAEEADAHVVQHEQQQDQREEPAETMRYCLSACIYKFRWMLRNFRRERRDVVQTDQTSLLSTGQGAIEHMCC